MTIIEKGPSKVLSPSHPGTEPRSGFTKPDHQPRKEMGKSPDGTLEKPGRRDTDLISTATSALRRLHFRSAGGSRPKRGQPTGSGTQGVPKLMLMGSSTASDTTTNTSTDSSNTVYTMVTVTDAEQEDKSESQPDQAQSQETSKPYKKDEKGFPLKGLDKDSAGRDQVRRKPDNRDKTRDILNEFDELFLENEKRINADKIRTKGKAWRNGVRHHADVAEETGKATSEYEMKRNALVMSGMTMMSTLSTMIETPEHVDEDKKTEKEKRSCSSASETIGEQSKQFKVNRQQDETVQKMNGSSSERESDDIFSSLDEQPAGSGPGAPPPTPQTGDLQKDQNFFSKTAFLDEETLKTLESAFDRESPDSLEKSDRPKSNIRTIHSELPQRTFASNVNKRKKIGDQDETRRSLMELSRTSPKYSPKPSPKSTDYNKTAEPSSTLFPFPPRTVSPSKTTLPKLKRNISNSLKKLADISSPIKLAPGSDKEEGEGREGDDDGEAVSDQTTSDSRKLEPQNAADNSKTAELSPLTQSNLEIHEKTIAKELQSKFDSLFNMDSPTTLKSSPPVEGDDFRSSNKSKFEFPSVTSPTEIDDAFVPVSAVSGDSEERTRLSMTSDDQSKHINNRKTSAADNHQTSLPSSKRKKRTTDRKSVSGETPMIKSAETGEGDKTPAGNRKSREISHEASDVVDEKFGRQNRKYSILTTDGSIKNFVSENSEEFKKTNESLNKENIKKKKTGNRRASECPQRHRRVSIIQGESLRHFIFEEPDTSRMNPNKQRKVDTTRNILLEDNVYKRKSSLIPGDTLRNLLGEDGTRKPFIGPDEKPRKFSINTLGDIVSARKFSLLPPGEIYTSQIDGKTTEIIKLAPGTKGRPLATIVVQQASIQRGSISGPSGGKEDSLLDVANTFTLEELHEFDMKYGSPHHCRSQSVKTPGRSCGRPNYLCLPQQRSRVASMPNTGVEEEYYRLRHFSITGKGVVNRGDSLKSRRSRSNNSVASSNSSHSTEHLPSNMGTAGSYPGSARTSAECSLASSRESSTSSVPYKVVMLGSAGVGKSSLISQFMTSEYLHAYDTSLDEEFGEKSVSVLLDDEESELIFVDHPSAEMSPENCITTYQPQAYIIVYSVVDRLSFQIAEETLQSLWKTDSIGSKAVILVGNKTDLVRSRTISSEEGKNMATSYDCKFIETSVGINHNVDELLVGILTQIRLKLQQAAKPKRNKSPLGRCIGKDGDSPKKWRKSRLTASLKVKGLLGRVWARDSRSKSCENLHVL